MRMPSLVNSDTFNAKKCNHVLPPCELFWLLLGAHCRFFFFCQISLPSRPDGTFVPVGVDPGEHGVAQPDRAGRSAEARPSWLKPLAGVQAVPDGEDPLPTPQKRSSDLADLDETERKRAKKEKKERKKAKKAAKKEKKAKKKEKKARSSSSDSS